MKTKPQNQFAKVADHMLGCSEAHALVVLQNPCHSPAAVAEQIRSRLIARGLTDIQVGISVPAKGERIIWALDSMTRIFHQPKPDHLRGFEPSMLIVDELVSDPVMRTCHAAIGRRADGEKAVRFLYAP